MKNKGQAKQVVLKGQGVAPGIAVGTASLFNAFSINLSELATSVESTENECELFESVRSKVLEDFQAALRQSIDAYGDQFSEIFESQIAFLSDPLLIDEIKSMIREENRSASIAVSTVLSQKSEFFLNLENTYFRDRAFDIIDLKQKLLSALLGIESDYQLNAPSIIIAENLSPADTVNFNRNLILGFLTDQGGETSHSAILARGLKIPSVVNGNSLSKVITKRDELIIDGFSGTIIVNPDSQTKEKYLNLKQEYESQQKQLIAENNAEAVTVDGQKVNLFANIEFAHELNDVTANNANGVGLFRTETLFLEGKGVPSEEQQFEVYKKLAEGLEDKPCIIRTVDLGGDKLVKGITKDSEENPFLGWRAIRLCLDRPEQFKPQLRAILRATNCGNIQILLPMVNAIPEVVKAKELINEAVEELAAEGIKLKNKPKIGVMIETPSAAIVAQLLGKYVDFFSIGSNDLTQYTLAVDRTNSRVAHSYTSFDPAVLKLMHLTTNAAVANNIPISICGEFASVPAAIPLLLGMGLRSFSITPHYIPKIKKIIRSVSLNSCIKLYSKIQTMHASDEIEAACEKFINKNVPELALL